MRIDAGFYPTEFPERTVCKKKMGVSDFFMSKNLGSSVKPVLGETVQYYQYLKIFFVIMVL